MTPRAILALVLIGLPVGLLAGSARPAVAQVDASPGLIEPGGFALIFDARGPLSYAALTPGNLPPDAVRLGPVQGRGCQFSLSTPVVGLSGVPRVSGALGAGGYEKALEDIRGQHPGLRGIYDVMIDVHVIGILTIFQRQCVEVTGRGFR